MNLENIRIRYVAIGIPLFMFGIIIMAIGIILNYLTVAIYGISFPIIRYGVVVGVLLMCVCVMAFPLFFKQVD